VALALAVLALAGCKKDPTPGHENGKRIDAAPPAQPPGTPVVFVGEGAHLRIAPRGDAPGAAVTSGPRGLRWVSRREGWVEVETGHFPETCYPWFPGLNAFRLRLWVKEADLLATLQREVKVGEGEDTWVRLLPGAAVSSTKDGAGRRAMTGTLDLSVVVPDDAVAPIAYAKQAEPFDGALTLERADAGPLVDAGPPQQFVRYHTEARIGADTVTLPSTGWTSNYRARAIAIEGDSALATLTTRCAELRVRVPRDAITGEPESGHINPRWPKEPEGNWVQPGTAVYWPDGSKAGEVRAPTAMGVGYRMGERRCFRRALLAAAQPDGTDPYLELCIDRDKLGS